MFIQQNHQEQQNNTSSERVEEYRSPADDHEVLNAAHCMLLLFHGTSLSNKEYPMNSSSSCETICDKEKQKKSKVEYLNGNPHSNRSHEIRNTWESLGQTTAMMSTELSKKTPPVSTVISHNRSSYSPYMKMNHSLRESVIMESTLVDENELVGKLEETSTKHATSTENIPYKGSSKQLDNQFSTYDYSIGDLKNYNQEKSNSISLNTNVPGIRESRFDGPDFNPRHLLTIEKLSYKPPTDYNKPTLPSYHNLLSVEPSLENQPKTNNNGKLAHRIDNYHRIERNRIDRRSNQTDYKDNPSTIRLDFPSYLSSPQYYQIQEDQNRINQVVQKQSNLKNESFYSETRKNVKNKSEEFPTKWILSPPETLSLKSTSSEDSSQHSLNSSSRAVFKPKYNLSSSCTPPSKKEIDQEQAISSCPIEQSHVQKNHRPSVPFIFSDKSKLESEYSDHPSLGLNPIQEYEFKALLAEYERENSEGKKSVLQNNSPFVEKSKPNTTTSNATRRSNLNAQSHIGSIRMRKKMAQVHHELNHSKSISEPKTSCAYSTHSYANYYRSANVSRYYPIYTKPLNQTVFPKRLTESRQTQIMQMYPHRYVNLFPSPQNPSPPVSLPSTSSMGSNSSTDISSAYGTVDSRYNNPVSSSVSLPQQSSTSTEMRNHLPRSHPFLSVHARRIHSSYSSAMSKSSFLDTSPAFVDASIHSSSTMQSPYSNSSLHSSNAYPSYIHHSQHPNSTSHRGIPSNLYSTHQRKSQDSYL